jgi:hypothetical protein
VVAAHFALDAVGSGGGRSGGQTSSLRCAVPHCCFSFLFDPQKKQWDTAGQERFRTITSGEIVSLFFSKRFVWFVRRGGKHRQSPLLRPPAPHSKQQRRPPTKHAKLSPPCTHTQKNTHPQKQQQQQQHKNKTTT